MLSSQPVSSACSTSSISTFSHLPLQLFKVLEHQYQLGLEGLHRDLPQIKCDLEFKNRRLQLRPVLEELRTEFYREIKKFISIPTSFKGLGYFEEGTAGKHKVLKIFRDMPDRNLRSLQVRCGCS